MDFEQIRKFRRINVVGTSGSGKSTLGKQLGELFDVPFFELDARHWQPNWQPTPADEMRKYVDEITAGERWVIDGNYTMTLPEKWQRVQLVVWLDLSFVRTVFRVTRRTIRRMFARKEIWPGSGNFESFRQSFLSRDSVILWAMSTHFPNRRKYVELTNAAEYEHVNFVRLRTPREVSAFLHGLRSAVNDAKSE